MTLLTQSEAAKLIHESFIGKIVLKNKICFIRVIFAQNKCKFN